MGCASLVCLRNSLQSKRSGKRERNPSDANEIKRQRADEKPEKNSLRERPPADFLQRTARKARTDKKKSGRETEFPKCEELLRKRCVLWTKCVDYRREKEKQNEPGNRDF